MLFSPKMHEAHNKRRRTREAISVLLDWLKGDSVAFFTMYSKVYNFSVLATEENRAALTDALDDFSRDEVVTLIIHLAGFIEDKSNHA